MSQTITLEHGSGGKASQNLVRDLILSRLDASATPMEDSAVLALPAARIAFSTDSFVVDPIFFPGGDIGDLAVNGTVNDLAMRGASPLYLTAGLILEEGFPLADLETIVSSMKRCADEAGIRIVAGDTKVVPRGKADKIFINTSGIGIVSEGVDISAVNARPGDAVLLSGTMADHGVTILCQQEGLRIKGAFHSDSAPLSGLVQELIGAVGPALHVLRDPTRGGVATALNEIAATSQVGVQVREKDLPVRDEVRGACDLLGLDPLYLANEGKLLAFVAEDAAEKALRVMTAHPLGRNARIIGQVSEDRPGRVILTNPLGTSRVIDMLHGHPLPRIC